jgi:glutamate synthase (NADH)
MSGGVAYVYDPNNKLQQLANADVASDLFPVEAPEDQKHLRSLVQSHLKHTGSQVARRMLLNWGSAVTKFKKVFPKDYARALAEAAAAKDAAAAEAPLELTSGDAFEQLKQLAAKGSVSHPPKAASLEGLLNGNGKADKRNLDRLALEGLPVKGLPATWASSRPQVVKEAPTNKVRAVCCRV